MAVGADHIALGDLSEHRGPGSVPQAAGDVELLVRPMVELEHHRVSLPAILARVLGEERQERDRSTVDLSTSPCTSVLDVAITVRGVVLLLVRGTAEVAVAVPLALRRSTPCKGGKGQMVFAAATSASPHDVDATPQL